MSEKYEVATFSIKLVKDGVGYYAHPAVSCSEDAYDILREYIGDDADREYLVVLLLDIKNHVRGINTVSIGSMTASVMHPREIFKPAVLASAGAILLGHNHPSGDPTPSKGDVANTERLLKVGKLMGIPILDHIIMGDGRYVSMKEKGLCRWI